MALYLLKQFVKGIALRGESSDSTENVEGSLFHNSAEQKIKSYIEGAVREVITESQVQTLTNKTISAADNLIVVASSNPNLTSVELNNALSELQTDIDSTSGSLASHISALDPHPQYETAVESQAKVDAHANRVDNPHSVTKTQVGLSNVDNTSDLNKPISTATQTALNLKYDASNPSGYVNAAGAAAAAPVQSVAGKVGAVSLAKSDVGLSNVDNTSDLNKPISTATQSALNNKQDLLGFTPENVSNKSTSTSLGVSDTLYPTQNAVKTYVDSSVSGISTPDATALVKGKLRLSGDLSGTADSPTVPGLATKEPSITAGTTSQYFRGDKTFQTLDKNAVGLSNVDNTSDANKPISTATQTALDLKIDESREGQPLGIATLDGTGKVPASQLPSYVDDVVEVASFAALPTTGESGKAYVTLDNNKVYRWSGSVYVEISPSIGATWGSITGTLAVQTDLQSALDGKANSTHTHLSSDITNFNESVDDRVSSLIVAGTNISANYDDLANTLTISSTVSVITDHTALSNIGINSHAAIDSHIASTSNPHSVTKSQVGLSNVPNIDATSRSNHTGTQTASTISDFNSAADARVSAGISAHELALDPHSQYETSAEVQSKVDAHANLTNNPHAVTKSQVGLGNVDNTSDLNKPISTATQLALDGKANTSHSHVATDITDLSEAIDDRISSTIVAGTNVTVSYDDLANTLTISAAGGGSGGATTLDGLTDVSVPSPTNGQALVYNTSTSQWEAQTISSGSGGATELNGLNDVTLSGTLDNQILRYDLASTQWKNETLLKDDIGLSNVDNTSDANKPISTATQTALNLKANSADVYTKTESDANFEPKNANIQSHISSTSNPHSVTKAQVGLGNVDNTSDADKPISTATQSALDGKANSVHTHVSTDITDFSESVDDRVSSLLVAGSNITLSYDDLANTLSISAVGAPASTSAERLITNVFNASGSPIPKMSAIYISGIQGDQPKVVLAQASTEATSSKTYGLVQTDIPNMSAGVIIEQGRLENLNTDVVGWVEGDPLWLSPTVAGEITNVKPSAPNHAVFIGYLIRKHQNVGVIQVSIQNGYELNELHNVAINGISNAQVIQYESATSLWKNHTLVKSDVGLSNVDNTADLDKPISTATQSALDGKANSVHTHVAADITDFNAAVDARIPTIPASVSSVNGDSGPDIILDSDDILEGTNNLYFSNERVDDRVNDLLVAGSGISLSYNDSANTLTITATGGGSGSTTKYVRGFTFSGAVTAGTSGVPVIITSAATINKIKTYGVGISGTWTFDLYKNGSVTPFQSLAISASSVVSVTSTESVLENDIITCVVNSAGAAGNDFSITLELS